MAATTGPGGVPILGRLVTSDPRSVWASEPLQFTPWLLQNADYLAEALGLELELEAAEYPVGTFSLDLVGRDLTRECRLIVENQLAGSDHGHLGQLLTYAAGTDAGTIVWVTLAFREEHRQAIDWLNAHTDETVRIFAITIEVVRIGESQPAAVLKVVAQPNDWGKGVKAATAGAAGASGKNARYQAFWSRYLERVRANHPGWTRVNRPQAANWMTLRAIGQAHINQSFVSRPPRLRSELYFGAAGADWNSRAYAMVEAQKASVEQAYGRTLDWEPLPGKIACRIADNRPGEIESETDYAEYLEWFEDTLGRWLNVVETLKLPALLASVSSQIDT